MASLAGVQMAGRKRCCGRPPCATRVEMPCTCRAAPPQCGSQPSELNLRTSPLQISASHDTAPAKSSLEPSQRRRRRGIPDRRSRDITQLLCSGDHRPHRLSRSRRHIPLRLAAGSSSRGGAQHCAAAAAAAAAARRTHPTWQPRSTGGWQVAWGWRWCGALRLGVGRCQLSGRGGTGPGEAGCPGGAPSAAAAAAWEPCPPCAGPTAQALLIPPSVAAALPRSPLFLHPRQEDRTRWERGRTPRWSSPGATTQRRLADPRHSRHRLRAWLIIGRSRRSTHRIAPPVVCTATERVLQARLPPPQACLRWETGAHGAGRCLRGVSGPQPPTTPGSRWRAASEALGCGSRDGPRPPSCTPWASSQRWRRYRGLCTRY
jgi:hypothetical protein